MDGKLKTYTNGEITIVWKQELCIHSTICWRKSTGLPDVFNPKERPWINPENGSTQDIIDQIKKCPSGALSFYKNGEDLYKENQVTECLIEVSKNGPLIVQGSIIVKDSNGNEIKKENRTAFCRCGHSSNKPYCDGNHRKINFQD